MPRHVREWADDGDARTAAATPAFGALDSLAPHTASAVLVGTFREAYALPKPTEYRAAVHHDEHVFQPRFLLADEFSDGAAVLGPYEKHAGGGLRGFQACVRTETAVNIIALSPENHRIDQELRNQEQRNALDAFLRAGERGAKPPL